MANNKCPKKVLDKIKKEKFIKVDIACGANKQGPDWVGIDFQKLPGVDIVLGVGRKVPCPKDVRAVETSVKIVFHTADLITEPGVAFSAPVGGV